MLYLPFQPVLTSGWEDGHFSKWIVVESVVLVLDRCGKSIDDTNWVFIIITSTITKKEGYIDVTEQWEWTLK